MQRRALLYLQTLSGFTINKQKKSPVLFSPRTDDVTSNMLFHQMVHVQVIHPRFLFSHTLIIGNSSSFITLDPMSLTGKLTFAVLTLQHT